MKSCWRCGVNWSLLTSSSYKEIKNFEREKTGGRLGLIDIIVTFKLGIYGGKGFG